jgi:release factor glutamine methyltransferase
VLERPIYCVTPRSSSLNVSFVAPYLCVFPTQLNKIITEAKFIVINSKNMLNRISMRDIHSVLKETTSDLRESESPRLDAEVLLAHALGLERADLYRYPNRVLTEEESDRFCQCLRRRQLGEPIAYITGRKEFWSLPFDVNRHVLIPRPDTEILVEETIRICKNFNIRKLLEIGTGSGAVSVALAATIEGIDITATDLSQEVLNVAMVNAATNGVGDRIRFLRGDVFQPVQGLFDMIVSNPPYISESGYDHLPIGIRCFEPAAALVAGPDGTEFHRLLMEGGRDYLTPGGWLLLEFGMGQKHRLEEMLTHSHYCEIGFVRDLSGLYRVAKGRKE